MSQLSLLGCSMDERVSILTSGLGIPLATVFARMDAAATLYLGLERCSGYSRAASQQSTYVTVTGILLMLSELPRGSVGNCI